MVYAGYLRAVPQSCHPNVKKQKRGTSIGGSPSFVVVRNVQCFGLLAGGAVKREARWASRRLGTSGIAVRPTVVVRNVQCFGFLAGGSPSSLASTATSVSGVPSAADSSACLATKSNLPTTRPACAISPKAA